MIGSFLLDDHPWKWRKLLSGREEGFEYYARIFLVVPIGGYLAWVIDRVLRGEADFFSCAFAVILVALILMALLA